MKYQVKSGCEITYPDGAFRGGRFYIVDGEREPQTIIEQGDSLELSRERQATVSPFEPSRLLEATVVTKATKKKAKKKAKKKKA
jgi:hypothetical protein